MRHLLYLMGYKHRTRGTGSCWNRVGTESIISRLVAVACDVLRRTVCVFPRSLSRHGPANSLRSWSVKHQHSNDEGIFLHVAVLRCILAYQNNRFKRPEQNENKTKCSSEITQLYSWQNRDLWRHIFTQWRHLSILLKKFADAPKKNKF